MTDTLFEDDPILGTFVAHFPSNRARLLLVSGAVLAVVWFIITVALWQVEEALASIITVAVLAIVTLAVGWYATHLWNREVVLYERGFSYREGSNTAFIRYEDVHSIRQKGERLAYFGGLLHRSTLQFTIRTDQDEIITLNSLYRRLEELTLRLENAITDTQQTRANQQLTDGNSITFGDDLIMQQDGLRLSERELRWIDFTGYRIEHGQLVIQARDNADWASLPLIEIDNLRLLVNLLRERQKT